MRLLIDGQDKAEITLLRGDSATVNDASTGDIVSREWEIVTVSVGEPPVELARATIEGETEFVHRSDAIDGHQRSVTRVVLRATDPAGSVYEAVRTLRNHPPRPLWLLAVGALVTIVCFIILRMCTRNRAAGWELGHWITEGNEPPSFQPTYRPMRRLWDRWRKRAWVPQSTFLREDYGFPPDWARANAVVMDGLREIRFSPATLNEQFARRAPDDENTDVEYIARLPGGGRDRPAEHLVLSLRKLRATAPVDLAGVALSVLILVAVWTYIVIRIAIP